MVIPVNSQVTSDFDVILQEQLRSCERLAQEVADFKLDLAAMKQEAKDLAKANKVCPAVLMAVWLISSTWLRTSPAVVWASCCGLGSMLFEVCHVTPAALP